MGYVIRATWTARAGEEAAVLGALRELAPLSRAEPGCLVYQAYQDPAEPRVFRLFEVYADEDAFKAHAASEHFQRIGLGDAIPRLENRERAFYQTLDI
jgi:quinol monooxygenase YgiN